MMKAMLKQLAAMAVTPPVAEEERLNHQGNGDGNQGGPGADEDGNEHPAHGMLRGASRNGNIEHHDDKYKSRSQGHKGNVTLLQGPADDSRGQRPEGDHCAVHHAIRLGAQIPIGNVHFLCLSASLSNGEADLRLPNREQIGKKTFSSYRNGVTESTKV